MNKKALFSLMSMLVPVLLIVNTGFAPSNSSKPFIVENNKAVTTYPIVVQQDYISELTDTNVEFVNDRCVKVKIKAKPDLYDMLKDIDNPKFYQKHRKKLDKWMNKKGKMLADIKRDLKSINHTPVWSYSNTVKFSKEDINMFGDEFTVCFDDYTKNNYVKFGFGTTTIIIGEANLSVEVDPFQTACLSHCKHNLKVCNAQTDTINISLSNFLLDLNEQMSNVYLYVKQNVTDYIKVPVHETTQIIYDGTNLTNSTLSPNCEWINSTHYYCNETVISGWTDKPISSIRWVKLTENNVSIQPGSCVDLKITYDVPVASTGKWNLTFIYNNQYYYIDPWWNSSWPYRKEVNITYSGASSVLNAQIPINISYESNMLANFSDIRFTWVNTTDNSEYEIPYWIESKLDSTWAYTWVKVPELYVGNTTLYLYYGNSVAQDESNGTAVFIFFDDFEDGSVADWVQDLGTCVASADTTTVYSGTYSLMIDGDGASCSFHKPMENLTRNFILEFNIRNTNITEAGASAGWMIPDQLFGHSATQQIGVFEFYDTTETLDWYNGVNNLIIDGDPDVWYKIKLEINFTSQTVDAWVNGVEEATGLAFRNAIDWVDYLEVGTSATVSDSYYDNIFVREYIVPEPTVTIGSEEAYDKPPVFNSAQFYRSFKETGTLSYCASNTVKYSSGTTTITANITIPSIQDYYLIVRHIKNSNTLSYYVNGNLVGSSSSTTGTACNNNYWVVEQFLVGASNFTANYGYVEIVPSGTDENYVDYVAFIPVNSTTLFGGGWDAVAVLNITDENGISLVNNTAVKLYSNENNLYYDFFTTPSSTGTYSRTYYANDTINQVSNATYSYEVDATPPSIYALLLDNVLIDYNETQDSLTYKANVTDAHLSTVLCSVNNTYDSTSNVSEQYSCTHTFSSPGTYEVKFWANDTLGNEAGLSGVVNVSKVNLSSTQVALYIYNFLPIPATNQSENIGHNFTAYFVYNLTTNVVAYHSFNETYCFLVEVENPQGNITNYNLSSWWNGQQFCWTDEFTESTTRYYTLNASTENITTYWQNDATDTEKRYYRIDTSFLYNDTLAVKIRMYLANPNYDPYNFHAELYECDVPSTTERYSCDGTWSYVASATGSNTEYIEYDTHLSSKLFFTDVVVGAQILQQSTTGGGAVTTTTTQVAEPVTEEAPPLPKLNQILLTPLFGISWLTPLTLGLALSIIYLLRRLIK